MTLSKPNSEDTSEKLRQLSELSETLPRLSEKLRRLSACVDATRQQLTTLWFCAEYRIKGLEDWPFKLGPQLRRDGELDHALQEAEQFLRSSQVWSSGKFDFSDTNVTPDLLSEQYYKAGSKLEQISAYKHLLMMQRLTATLSPSKQFDYLMSRSWFEIRRPSEEEKHLLMVLFDRILRRETRLNELGLRFETLTERFDRFIQSEGKGLMRFFALFIREAKKPLMERFTRFLREVAFRLQTYLQLIFVLCKFSGWPDGEQPRCMSMPWNIRPVLVVLWGVCWMFYSSPEWVNPSALQQPREDENTQVDDTGKPRWTYYETSFSPG